MPAHSPLINPFHSYSSPSLLFPSVEGFGFFYFTGSISQSFTIIVPLLGHKNLLLFLSDQYATILVHKSNQCNEIMLGCDINSIMNIRFLGENINGKCIFYTVLSSSIYFIIINLSKTVVYYLCKYILDS